MNRGYIRGHVDRSITDGPLRFVAATEGVKRDGIDLRMTGAELERFRANPVVLFGHNSWGRENLPIGRADNVTVDGDSLMMDIEFDREDEFANKVERKIRTGFLNAVSIGFEVRSWEKPGQNAWVGGVATKWELFETSVVPVPMDEKATVASGRSLHDENLRQFLEEEMVKRIKEGIAEYFLNRELERKTNAAISGVDASKVLASFNFEGVTK